MEHFAGKYKLVKNDNIVECLVSIGLPEDRAQKAAASWPTVDATVNGKTILMKTDQPPNFSTTLVLDQENDEKMTSGTVVKTTLKLDGGKLIASSQGGAYDMTRTYEVSGNELVVTLSSSKTTTIGKKIYKKL